jgi:hypothetical protein
MRTLMEWMGHADITTTLAYADYAPSERERGWVGTAFSSAGPESIAIHPLRSTREP